MDSILQQISTVDACLDATVGKPLIDLNQARESIKVQCYVLSNDFQPQRQKELYDLESSSFFTRSFDLPGDCQWRDTFRQLLEAIRTNFAQDDIVLAKNEAETKCSVKVWWQCNLKDFQGFFVLRDDDGLALATTIDTEQTRTSNELCGIVDQGAHLSLTICIQVNNDIRDPVEAQKRKESLTVADKFKLQSDQGSIDPEGYAKQSEVARQAIKEAILVANSILTKPKCGVIFVYDFDVDLIETTSRLQEVAIKFGESDATPATSDASQTISDASQTTSDALPTTSDATPTTSVAISERTFDIGWTNRKPNDRVIYLNKRFQERLEAITTQEESIGSVEWRTIVVSLGLTLVHECAHLMMRWTLLPFQQTPAIFDFEAGEYIEKQLFDGLVSVIAEMDKDSNEWDGPNVPIKYLAIQKIESGEATKYKRIQDAYISGIYEYIRGIVPTFASLPITTEIVATPLPYGHRALKCESHFSRAQGLPLPPNMCDLRNRDYHRKRKTMALLGITPNSTKQN